VGARVSAGAVKEIIATDLSGDVILTSMIDTANLYIDTHLSSAGHGEPILRKIELYLAAHFVALTEEKGGMVRDKLGDAETEFADNFSDGIGSTRFGQTAISLDTSGTLASLGAAKLKAQFRVV